MKHTSSGGAADAAIAAAAADFESSKKLGSGEADGDGSGNGPHDAKVARSSSAPPRRPMLPQIARIMTPSGSGVSGPPALKRSVEIPHILNFLFVTVFVKDHEHQRKHGVKQTSTYGNGQSD